MTNHPNDLAILDSRGPPAGVLFSKDPLEDELKAMVATIQDISTFGIAGRIWDSSYVIDAFLRGPSDQFTFTPPCPIPREYFLPTAATPTRSAREPPALDLIRIIELGAGTGYVGIALAKRLRPFATLVLTDLEEVIPLLEKNVQGSFHRRVGCGDLATAGSSISSIPSVPASEQQACARLEIEPLEWGNSTHAAKILAQGRVDYIVASDLVYFPELYPPLLQTLREITDLKTRIIFGYKDREQWKEMPFWEQFGRFFEMEVVEIEKTKNITVHGRDQDDENDDDDEELASIFGSEADMFVFVAKKRRDEDILTGVDDTLTTLMMRQIRC
ncbi:hypothetical protein BGZ94_000246 [Podila epigama]|nr:hypothetical protein BGZ94_000246 [Podila epigama]